MLLLAACTGDPTAEPRQEVSATRTEPSWPPASVLSLPEPTSPDPAMGRDAKARVVAYAVHLVDQVQYALRTTFPAAVLRSDAFCQICSQINDLAAEAHQDQEVYDFDDWSVQVLQMRELPDDPEVRYWKVRTLLDQPELTARDSSGDVVGTIPARRRQTVLVVGHTDNEWVIYEWRVVEDAPGSTA
ncbi:hypothetical protein NPS01_12950 [Nocardioides psychrotolerans]|uniref:hypothetical protein n=1 Tax=Nocardioides psychrotolerans TaxID=1005945 RepID=UPI000B80863A|nr:hypothetical protein [Nocardioides psychrotolerans]GEP37632.1 hypothetical protein NPS01_12950 [Nocardioides psychrotolerans]